MMIFGGAVTLAFVVLGSLAFHMFFKKKFAAAYERLSPLQYGHLVFFFVTMMALPVKMILRLGFTVKYVWVTPWFNV